MLRPSSEGNGRKNKEYWCSGLVLDRMDRFFRFFATLLVAKNRKKRSTRPPSPYGLKRRVRGRDLGPPFREAYSVNWKQGREKVEARF